MVIYLSANIVTNASLFKKRILLLFGSPHHVGNTFRLVMQLLEQLEENSFYLEQFDLFEMDLIPCTDCQNCEHGLCCYNHIDHYDDLIEAVQHSDIILLASPVYCAGFPAPVKAMMDRAQQFYVNQFDGRKNTFPQRKKGFLLMTGGNCGERLQEYLTIPTKMFFDCLNVELSGKIIVGNTDKTQKIEADFTDIIASINAGPIEDEQ